MFCMMDFMSRADVDTLDPLQRVKSWCIETALPYWGEVGFDQPANAFHERLELSGRPDLSAPRRTMVQGRQIYAFAQAARLGWFSDGAILAQRAADNMIGFIGVRTTNPVGCSPFIETAPSPTPRVTSTHMLSHFTDFPGFMG